jgi:hypothetical protein
MVEELLPFFFADQSSPTPQDEVKVMNMRGQQFALARVRIDQFGRDLLGTEWQNRHHQVFWQVIGDSGITGVEPRQKLGISSSQKRMMLKETMNRTKNNRPPVPGPSEEKFNQDVESYLEADRQIREAVIRELLTEDQKKKWQEILGEPLDKETVIALRKEESHWHNKVLMPRIQSMDPAKIIEMIHPPEKK